jgi:hypothetical protein
MIRRVLKNLKPISLALLVLVLAPCVLEFLLRLSACRSGFRTESTHSTVSTVPSWHAHHELEPFQAADLPVADSETPGQTIEFRTNSLGLRGAEVAVPKPRDVFRIVCVGDETVLAPEIAYDATFGNVLQRRLQAVSDRPIEVINAGIPDFCPLLSYLQVKHQLAGLDPDLIIAHFDMSDVWDDRRFRRLTDLGESEQPLACVNPSLNNQPRILPLTDNFLIWKWVQGNIGGVFGKASARPADDSFGDPRTKYDWLSDDSAEWALPLNLTLSAWDHLAAHCQGRGTRLLLAVHPAPWQISPTAARGARIPEVNGVYSGTEYDSDAPFERIRVFARTRRLPLCDVSTAFRSIRNPDNLFQSTSRGFSTAGHELYAAQLDMAIRRLIPAPLMPSQRGARQVSWPAPPSAMPSTSPPDGIVPVNQGFNPARREPGTSANAPHSLSLPGNLSPIRARSADPHSSPRLNR